MLETTVKIVNPLGLHARAAAQLIRLAGQYQSTITITRREPEIAANAQSILDILDLAAREGDELVVTADGDDESEALNAVSELFRTGFGEM